MINSSQQSSYSGPCCREICIGRKQVNQPVLHSKTPKVCLLIATVGGRGRMPLTFCRHILVEQLMIVSNVMRSYNMIQSLITIGTLLYFVAMNNLN